MKISVIRESFNYKLFDLVVQLGIVWWVPSRGSPSDVIGYSDIRITPQVFICLRKNAELRLSHRVFLTQGAYVYGEEYI
jgi:hypothetical protein